MISRTIVPVTIQNKVLPMMPNGDNDQAGIGDTMVDSTGAFINQNDDGGSNVPADSVTGSHFDTFLQALLAPGNYTVSVMAFSNFANGPNLSNGFTGTGSFVDVNSNQRDSHWAFDILNVGAASEVVPGVPEPSTWAMMMLGFGVTGFAIRRSRRKAEQKQIPRAI